MADTLSRSEDILTSIINGEEVTTKPLSRVEELLVELADVISEGGGGGFTPTDAQLDAMNSGITTEDVEQISTNKNNIKANFSKHTKNIFTYSIDELKANNPGGSWDGNEYTAAGITYTINDDMTISLSGSVTPGAGMSFIFLRNNETVLEYEGLHGSGCPSGGGMDKYALIFNMECIDSGEGVIIHNPQFIAILITEGTEPPSESFKPMICTVADWEESPEYAPRILTNRDLTEFSDHVYDNLSVKYAITSTKCKPIKTYFFGFAEKSWSGISGFSGYYIWTAGGDIFYCYSDEKYIYNRSISQWEPVNWSGRIYGNNIWTDGENTYYSSDNDQYVFDTSTLTWSAKTWNGLTRFRGENIWTDGENIYYSSGSDQYVLDVSTSTWSTKTWNGYTRMYGSGIWTDGENIYYSSGSDQYVLDVSTSTWSAKTWNGYTNIMGGSGIWTDGENIYYSSGSDQYVLDVSTSTWSTKTWNGYTRMYGSGIWTDGENIYYSDNNKQYVLKKVSVR